MPCLSIKLAKFMYSIFSFVNCLKEANISFWIELNRLKNMASVNSLKIFWFRILESNRISWSSKLSFFTVEFRSVYFVCDSNRGRFVRKNDSKIASKFKIVIFVFANNNSHVGAGNLAFKNIKSTSSLLTWMKWRRFVVELSRAKSSQYANNRASDWYQSWLCHTWF